MKVLLINGSARKNGNTNAVIGEMAGILQAQGLETEVFWVGNGPIRDCTGCGTCKKNKDNACVFKDDYINDLIAKCQEADGFVFGTPVYYSHPSGALLSVLNRVYYAAGNVLRASPAAPLPSQGAAAPAWPFRCSTNTSCIMRCPWCPAPTGPCSTAPGRRKCSRTRKECKPSKT
ncbi:MAG: flavodoxin family protein [Christensenellales bacterium]|jgi:multimeric flavodoxin WrbA